MEILSYIRVGEIPLVIIDGFLIHVNETRKKAMSHRKPKRTRKNETTDFTAVRNATFPAKLYHPSSTTITPVLAGSVGFEVESR